MSETLDRIKENRLMRMRAGQTAGELVQLPSDPEIRFVLVPLTDGEYLHSLKVADDLEVGDNIAGLSARDQIQKQSIIAAAAREIDDWTQRVFSGIDEVAALDTADVGFLYDEYLGMMAQFSPSLYMMPPEEFENLRDVWQRIEWNALSGMQQYAAMRFLRLILPDLLQGNSSGSLSTLKSTQTNDSIIPVESVDPSSSEKMESSVASPVGKNS